jgi:hypothetical protein
MTTEQKFTGIVYYHGIGEQSRYEAISGLVQSFEDYVEKQGGNFEFKVSMESSDEIGKSVSYIEVIHQNEHIRFYEVYWAPITAGGASGLGVFTWMLNQISTPIEILRSPWNTRQRMRRGYLYALWEEKNPDAVYRPKVALPLIGLLKHYHIFCGYNEQEKKLNEIKNKGSFKEFVQYLTAENATKEEIDLAHEWRHSIRRKELWNLAILATLGHITLLIPIILLAPLLRVLWMNVEAGHIMPRNPAHALLYVLAFLIILLGSTIGRFLRYFGGDVQFWATYQETNEKYRKRKEILAQGYQMLLHVLKHKDCNRVIVMGHSLGTPISMDSLLAIGRTMRTQGIENQVPVENIDAYITIASPIDKIHYFFESQRGKVRHYENIVDDVRGDIGTNPSPFRKRDGSYHFKWFNFWDRNDYISGALYTPFPQKYTPDKINQDYYLPQLYNLRVENYDFPAPARAHGGYFRHHDVLHFLYEYIFRSTDSIRLLRTFLGTEYERKSPSLYRRLTAPIRAVLPHALTSEENGLRDVTLFGLWSLLFVVIGDCLNLELLTLFFKVIFMLTTGSIIGLAISSIRKGHRHPFRTVKTSIVGQAQQKSEKEAVPLTETEALKKAPAKDKSGSSSHRIDS